MRIWEIKHWFKYQPQIAYYRFMAWYFGLLTKLTDKLGYIIFGIDKWEQLKRENE